MRAHLYEFHSEKRKLKCLCGWERNIKKADVGSVQRLFEDHRERETALQRG